MTEATKGRPTHQADMLAWIEARPEGATAREAREHFVRTTHAVSCGLARLMLLGVIGWVDVPNPSTARGAKKTVRRYFARAHCPSGATRAEVVTPLVRPPKLKAIPAVPNFGSMDKPRPPLATSDEFRAAEAIITERTKREVCPAGKDERFTPRHVPPFFAAGKRLEPRPWVVAVTGRAEVRDGAR